MTESPDQLLEEAQRLTDEVSALWNAGAYPQTEAVCARALDLTRKAVGNRDRRVAERLYNLASLYHLQRRFEEAKPLYKEAIQIHKSQSRIDDASLAFCYAWLAKTCFEAWRDDPGIDGANDGRSFGEAESCYRKALQVMERAGRAESPEYSGALVQLGFLYYYCDRAAEAEPLFLEALRLREAVFGPDHLETAEPIGRLAILYRQDERSETDPEPFMRSALAIRRKHLDTADPEVWEWIYRLAEFCAGSDNEDEAEILFNELGDLLLDESYPLHEEVDWIVTGYLDTLVESDQLTKAAKVEARWCKEPTNVRLKRQELRRREEMLGPDHPRVADSLCELADDLRFEVIYDEALALYRRALLILECAESGDSPVLLPILNGMALVLRAQEDWAAAGAILERACAIPVAPTVFADSLQHARAIEQLAWVRATDEDGAEADRLFKSALSLVEALVPFDYRESAEMHYRFSIYLFNAGRFAEAEKSIVTALRAADKADDVDELEIADYREQYAAILTKLDLPLQASVQLAKVKQAWEACGAPREDL